MDKTQIKTILKVSYLLIVVAFAFFLFSISKSLLTYKLFNDEISNFLNENEYDEAMKLIGGYYNKDYVYCDDNLVIFESATLTDDKKRLDKTLSVFVYESNDFYKAIINGDIEIELDCEDTSYIYFTIDQINTNIESIKLLGSESILIDNLNLSFYTAFFNDVDLFIVEYNNDPNSEDLEYLDNDFRSKNDNYQKSVESKSVKKTNLYVLLIMLGYALVVLIIYDLALGKRFLLLPFKKIIKKNKN